MTRSQTAAALLALLALCGVTKADEAGSALKPAMDLSVRPGDDFYAYANGGWLKATTLPSGRAAYGTSDMLRERNARRVEELVQHAANPATARSPLEQKVGDFYASLADVKSMEAKGIAPLDAELARIRAIDTRTALADYLGHATRLGDGAGAPAESIFAVWIHPGFSQADRNLAHLQQGGLGLSGRDDYLDGAPDKVALRAQYQALVASVLRRFGTPDPDAQAARILALETTIAQAHASQADTDDVFKSNNLWQRADFDMKAPGMDWGVFFAAAGLDGQHEFVVWQPSAASGISRAVANEDLEVWKNYLAVHLVKHYAPAMPAVWRDPFLSFSGQPTDGAEARALAMTQDKFGEAIGRLYVARWFLPQAKRAANAMVANIRTAFRARIANAAWMAPATKATALAKLDALVVGMGYPDSWTDYTDLLVVHDDALGNVRRIEEFAYSKALSALNRPVERNEWTIAPQSVSALINFFPNAEQFSAGLLQPPYFDYQGDVAANYGSAGAGLSHEVSHSFDQLGNIYGADGTLGLWWSADDTQRFTAASAPLAAQLDADCPKPDLCLHGKQVLSEATADLAGLMVAYDAYHLSLHGTADAVKDGLSGDQRFFIAYAQRWRKLQTDTALRQQIQSDTHPPGRSRANAVRNMDAWYRAFAVTPQDKLYLPPEARLHVW